MRAGRRIDAGLVLLDRQIIDADGLFAGNVDDLELAIPEDGEPPYITAILAGPGALSRRIGGRVGAWIESVHARLHPDQEPAPASIPFGVVKRVGVIVEVSLGHHDLPITRFEDWVRDHLIVKIPGARRAPD